MKIVAKRKKTKAADVGESITASVTRLTTDANIPPQPCPPMTATIIPRSSGNTDARPKRDV